MINKVQWDASANGAMTEAAIRGLHLPSDRYRVSVSPYDAGSRLAGSQRQGTIYVLQGCFELQGMLLNAGEMAEFDEGTYGAAVIGPETAIVVYVWKLPSALWGAPQR